MSKSFLLDRLPEVGDPLTRVRRGSRIWDDLLELGRRRDCSWILP